jgi:predicted transposase YbfD/YdcC
MIVKGNHPSLLAVLPSLFEPPLGQPAGEQAMETREVGHGRIETRRLTVTLAGVAWLNWPGVAQVFRLERSTVRKRTGQHRVEVVYGLTSVPRPLAGAKRLLAWVRGQWRIENRSHWVRDVTYDEDRSQVRCGSIPQVLAALRNTALGLLRLAGHDNIAAANRYSAARPTEAVALLGAATDN